MIERDLYEQYRLNGGQLIKYRGYHAFYEKGDQYVIVPAAHVEQEELLELKQISDYLQYQKENRIASFVPTVAQELIGKINEESIILFKLPHFNNRHFFNEGQDLASFHKIGRFYPQPPQKATRLGQWKTLWENRLDQLEHWWAQKLPKIPANRFEKLFYETFPYYLGLSENAIQYIADCLWEDERNEVGTGTICLIKYQPQTGSDGVIFPTELIYDHPTRDIAEWIRSKYEAGAPLQEVIQFLNNYEQHLPLSSIGWRMLYGRLLFPLSYFETIEGYYSAPSENAKEWYERKFFNLINQTESYEHFLRTFYKNIGLPARSLQIPEIEWLQSVKN